MAINHYDDETFFDAYAKMQRSQYGLSCAGEWYLLENMLPEIKDKQILDLGCGYGWHSQYFVDCGANKVIAIDCSKKMIETAKTKHTHPKIEYYICNLEEYNYPTNTFDMVFSNLVLHYVEDLTAVYRKVYQTLKPNGEFIFNIEHPVFTAGINQDWIYNAQGDIEYWAIDMYYYSNKRNTQFLGCDIQKYHHTLTQIINELIVCGFVIETIQEVCPNEEMLKQPDMIHEMRRPMMLLVKARKR